MSLPSAPMARSAATAAALPPLDPPGTRSVFHGLRVGPKAEFSVEEPNANSSMLALGTSSAPSARNRSMTVASYGERKPYKMREPQVISSALMQMLLLIVTGMPKSFPRRAVLSCSCHWRRS